MFCAQISSWHVGELLRSGCGLLMLLRFRIESLKKFNHINPEAVLDEGMMAGWNVV